MASESSVGRRHELSHQFSGRARKNSRVMCIVCFFMAFRRLELDERKLENWDYRHKEFSDIMEETLNWRALRLPKSIDERILEEERTEFLHRAINTLPEIQRRRFLLYYECDYKCYEIGAMEHRSAAAVAKSIASARKKVKEQMRKYLSA